jgi:hypothetical protein
LGFGGRAFTDGFRQTTIPLKIDFEAF